MQALAWFKVMIENRGSHHRGMLYEMARLSRSGSVFGLWHRRKKGIQQTEPRELNGGGHCTPFVLLDAQRS